jgi:uncharacterized protein with PIN domain
MAVSTSDEPLQFACDAMLGGLARWLRAAGYDASWHPEIDDWELIRIARQERRFLLTSDTGIFRIGIVRDGELPALFIPHGMGKSDQLRFVIEQLQLSTREPRCMACGGELRERTREDVRDRVPTKSLAWLDRFYECVRCRKVFWHGTHWQRIEKVLGRLIFPGTN